MSAGWTIRVPESGTNSILDPSAESGVTTNYAAVNSATVTQDTTQARFGNYSYKVVLGSTNRGLSLTTGALLNFAGYVTFYVYGTVTGTLQVSQDAGSNYNAATVIGGSSGAWVRYGAVIPQAQRNGSTATLIRDTLDDGTLYIDGVMDQALAYATTYIDGDQGALYRWTGLRHGSTSTRDAQDRTGGRDRDLYSVYGINVRQMVGAGMEPITNNQQPYALQPGNIFQSYKSQQRVMTLILDIHAAATIGAFHSARKALINLIKPDAYRGAQPFVLGYQLANSGKYVYGAFRYDGGLGLGQMDGGANWIEQGGKVPVTVIANDPFWYEDSVDTQALTLQTTFSWVRGAMRINGLWSALGSGFQSDVRAIAYDSVRGRIYFGGLFTTANGVTVNRVTYWNGTTFVAMDSGVNGEVDCLCVMPNGDLYVGGKFTTVGGAATAAKGLARWNVVAGTWTVPTATATTFVAIYALACDVNGNLYGGGDFALYNGIANTVNIWKYDGTTFTALGTGMNGIVYALLRDNNGTTIWVGGAFTQGNAVVLNFIGYWNGTTFGQLLTSGQSGLGGGGTSVRCLAQKKNGLLYLGGSFDHNAAVTITLALIAAWNGTTFTALGTGLTVSGGGYVASIAVDATGLVLVNGLGVLTCGPFTNQSIYAWNGYTWIVTDIDTTTLGANVYAVAPIGNDLAMGGDTTGNILTAAQTTATLSATATVFPVIIFKATTTAASQTTLIWLENQSTGQRLYFNLTINTGETVTISFLPGNKVVVSDWRGVITTQPLSASDFAAWCLLPGANTIAALVTGTTTGAALIVHAQPRHHSIDGSAT